MDQPDFSTQSRDRDLAELRAYIEEAMRKNVHRLPSEAQLSEELSISRAKLRGALKKLEREGLIWRHVGKGTFIGERSLMADLTAMPNVLTPPEAFEARLAIEPQLAAMAAVRATPEQVEEMLQCLSQMERLNDFDQWAVWDQRMHRLVAKAARNTLLLAVYDTIRESAPSGMRNITSRIFSTQTRAESNEEHRRFIEAIADHDPVLAKKFMREHLLALRQIMFGSI